MSKETKRVRLTDESLNSYGTRIITAGIRLEKYHNNPVMLYMHMRGSIIGRMTEIQVQDGEITAVPEFDEASELSCTCKKQWEFGSLRMASIGVTIQELSDDPALLLKGQKYPTITKCTLDEVSLVDIGANPNALVLRYKGKAITLGEGSENPLPLLPAIEPTQQPQPDKTDITLNNNDMDIKTIALNLGLPETADEAAVTAKLSEMKAAASELENVKKRNEELEQARITTLVDDAVHSRRLSATKKDHFINLGKQVGYDSLKATLDALPGTVRLSSMLPGSGAAPGASGSTGTYSKLSEVPEGEIMQLRDGNPDEYRRLYKAEYGFECAL